MNIVVVASSIAPEDGGPTTAVLSIVSELRKMGEFVELLTTDYSPRGESREQLASRVPGGAKLFPYRGSQRFRFSLPLLRQTLISARTSDHVHVHGHYMWASICVFLACYLFNVPYSVHAHGVFEPYDQSRNRSAKRIYDWMFGDRIMCKARHVMADTADEATKIRRKYPLANICILALGAPTPDCEPRLALHDEPTVLFLARIAPKKRVDLFVSAIPHILKFHPEARFVIAGEDSQSLARNALKGQPKELLDRVQTIGFVEGQRKAEVFRSSDIYMLPSENENFGISVIEAMAHGLPVVITADVALADQIVEANAGVVTNERSPADLGSAVCELLADHQRYRAASRNAVELVKRSYTWERTAHQFLAILSAP